LFVLVAVDVQGWEHNVDSCGSLAPLPR
jgi:hypothetical protein